MKFLYLSDWLSVLYRERRLTDYPWRFYHYGPYASTAQHGIDAAVESGKITMEQISDPDDRDVFLYRRRGDDPEFWRHIGVGFEARLRRLIEQWIHRPRNELLDFVYFGTEPMLAARRGDLLDFSTIQRTPPSTPSQSRRERSPEAQVALERFLARARTAVPLDPPPVYDELYDRALSHLDEQDLPRGPLRGEVDLGPDPELRRRE